LEAVDVPRRDIPRNAMFLPVKMIVGRRTRGKATQQLKVKFNAPDRKDAMWVLAAHTRECEKLIPEFEARYAKQEKAKKEKQEKDAPDSEAAKDSKGADDNPLMINRGDNPTATTGAIDKEDAMKVDEGDHADAASYYDNVNDNAPSDAHDGDAMAVDAAADQDHAEGAVAHVQESAEQDADQ